MGTSCNALRVESEPLTWPAEATRCGVPLPTPPPVPFSNHTAFPSGPGAQWALKEPGEEWEAKVEVSGKSSEMRQVAWWLGGGSSLGSGVEPVLFELEQSKVSAVFKKEG